MKSLVFLLLALSGVALAMHISPLISATETNFYDLCDKTDTVKCAGSWTKSSTNPGSPCLVTRNCTKGVAMETTDAGLVFHVFSNYNVSYVALGFSNDTGMGNDAVAACIRNDADQVSSALSYNVGFSSVAAGSNDGLAIAGSTIEDTVFYCKLTLADPLKFARSTDNNTDTDYYVIAAVGSMDEDGNLGHHSGNVVSDEKWTVGSLPIVPGSSFDAFYDTCANETTKCIGAWVTQSTENNACFQSRNCSKAIAMETSDDGYVFHLLATDVAYMSVGFSKDTDMGDESVVACIVNDTNVAGALSYNVGHKNLAAESNEGLTVGEAKVEDGTVYCKFTLEDTLKYARYFTNNTDTEFYIVGAAGKLEKSGALGHHSGALVSTEMWSLTSSGVTIWASSVLLAASYIIANRF